MMTRHKFRPWRRRAALAFMYAMVLGLGILVIIKAANGPVAGQGQRIVAARAAAMAQAAAKPAGPEEEANRQERERVKGILDSYLAKRGRNARTYLAAYQMGRRVSARPGDCLHYLRSAAACNDPGTAGWLARLTLAGQEQYANPSCTDVLKDWVAAQPDNSYPRIRLADFMARSSTVDELLAFLGGLNQTTHYDDGSRELGTEQEAFHRLQGSSPWDARKAGWERSGYVCAGYAITDVLNKAFRDAQKAGDLDRADMLAAAVLGLREERHVSQSLMVRNMFVKAERDFLKTLVESGGENSYVRDFKGLLEESAAYFETLDRAMRLRKADEPPALTPGQQAQFNRLMASQGEADAFFYLARELKEPPVSTAAE